MRKKFIKMLIAGLVVLQLAACGNPKTETKEENTTEAAEENTEAAETTETVYLKDFNPDDYVTLGEYRGLTMSNTAVEVTDEEVSDFIDYTLEQQSELKEVTDRDVVENGDTVNIDYEGKKDGVAFDGGTAQGYDLTIGSNSFIEGFEEGLIGVKKGETVDLNLTFPENYQAEDLAGAEVVFTVTVNTISEPVVPELTDEFVKGLNLTDASTVEEFKAYAREYLEEQAQAEADYLNEGEVLEQLLANAVFGEIPQELIDKYVNYTYRNMEEQAAMYGIDIQTFVTAMYGMDMEAYEAAALESGTASAKYALIYLKIAQAENMEITDAEVEEALEAEYAYYGFTDKEEYKAAMDMESYKETLLNQKVSAFLLENAILTE